VGSLGGWVRYLVEWGCGATLSHEDPALAARRAVMDATSRVCHLNFEALGGVDMERDLLIEVVVGVPYPERVRAEDIEDLIPYNCGKRVRVVKGGLVGKGVYSGGRFVEVVIAVSFITIYVRAKR